LKKGNGGYMFQKKERERTGRGDMGGERETWMFPATQEIEKCPNRRRSGKAGGGEQKQTGYRENKTKGREETGEINELAGRYSKHHRRGATKGKKGDAGWTIAQARCKKNENNQG